jgi:sulfoxide reductase heme-binding subunit YedZ
VSQLERRHKTRGWLTRGFRSTTRHEPVDDARWIEVCHRDDLVEGLGRPVVIDGLALAVFVTDGDVVVLGNQCAHRDFPIDAGPVLDGCVSCPWHGWRFDLRTGDHLTSFGPRRGLPRYAAMVANDTVWVERTS